MPHHDIGAPSPGRTPRAAHVLKPSSEPWAAASHASNSGLSRGQGHCSTSTSMRCWRSKLLSYALAQCSPQRFRSSCVVNRPRSVCETKHQLEGARLASPARDLPVEQAWARSSSCGHIWQSCVDSRRRCGPGSATPHNGGDLPVECPSLFPTSPTFVCTCRSDFTCHTFAGRSPRTCTFNGHGGPLLRCTRRRTDEGPMFFAEALVTNVRAPCRLLQQHRLWFPSRATERDTVFPALPMFMPSPRSSSSLRVAAPISARGDHWVLRTSQRAFPSGSACPLRSGLPLLTSSCRVIAYLGGRVLLQCQRGAPWDSHHPSRWVSQLVVPPCGVCRRPETGRPRLRWLDSGWRWCGLWRSLSEGPSEPLDVRCTALGVGNCSKMSCRRRRPSGHPDKSLSRPARLATRAPKRKLPRQRLVTKPVGVGHSRAPVAPTVGSSSSTSEGNIFDATLKAEPLVDRILLRSPYLRSTPSSFNGTEAVTLVQAAARPVSLSAMPRARREEGGGGGGKRKTGHHFRGISTTQTSQDRWDMNVNCKVWWRLDRSTAWDVRMSMNAHVTTIRRQDRHQDEQQKNYLKISQKLNIRSRVHTWRRPTAALSTTNQKAENKGENVGIHETW